MLVSKPAASKKATHATGQASKAEGETRKNEAARFASAIMRSQLAQTSGDLWTDYQLLVKGHAVYLPHFFCDKTDFALLQGLTNDLEKNAGQGMINWSQHLKHENPDFSPTFQTIVQRMADYFDVEVFATRLNFYPDASSWKPFHHDSHAYVSGANVKEDFTMGASFGATRALVFLHPSSQQQFSFPQENGDIFSFTSTVNQRFMHGVPRSTAALSGPAPRFSVIAWGKRRSLNSRNAGADELGKDEPGQRPPAPGKAKAPAAASAGAAAVTAAPAEREKEVVMSIGEVTELVERFVLDNTPKAVPKPAAQGRSRVQGGWAAPAADRGGRGGRGAAGGRGGRGSGGGGRGGSAAPGGGAPRVGGWGATMGANRPALEEQEESSEEGE